MNSIGLCLNRGVALPHIPGIDPGPFTLALTGLTDGTARPGGEAAIGYAITPDTGTANVRWGTEPGDATYGTAPTPSDFTAGDGGNLVLTVTDGTATVVRSAPIRYAEGAASAIAAAQAWTVDDTSVDIDASASGTGLAWSYAAAGLPTGVAINTATGAITGALRGAGSGTITVTATDQYSRTVEASFTWSASLRTQAFASDELGAFNWTVGDTTVSVNAASDFASNGNRLTYTATGLPSGLSIVSNGIISGIPTAVSSGVIVITATDEYERQTISTSSHTTVLRQKAIAADTLADQTFAADTGVQTYDASVDFTANGNTLTYSLPAAPSGVMINNGTGVVSINTATSGQLSAANVVVRATDEYGRATDSGFSLTVEAVASFTLSETSDGELELNGATGEVTVTIISPTAYAGTYIFAGSDTATGPVNLKSPVIVDDGMPLDGETLTVIPGLWVYNPDNGGLRSPSYQWQANSSSTGTYADLGGATSTIYTLTTAEAGDAIRVVETLADNAGSRSASSTPVSVDAPTQTGPTLIFSDDFSVDTTENYSVGGWEVTGGEAGATGNLGNINAIFLTNEPVLNPAGYFVRGTVGTVGTSSQPLRIRAKMDANWGSSYSHVSIEVYGSLVRLNRNGQALIQVTPPGGINMGDVYELRIFDTGTRTTVLLNGVVIDPSMENVDVSMIPNTTRVAFGLRNDWGLDSFAVGNL